MRCYAFAHSPLLLKRSVFRVVLLELVPRHLSLLWWAYTMCFVNKVTPINFFDGRCHIKQLRAGKSHKICLTNHTWSISYHIMPLVINGLEGGDTHTHGNTDMQAKAISRNQAHTGLRPVRAWFKNVWTKEH